MSAPQSATAPPTLYFDLASPYAYLAVARAGAVLGVEPDLQPVLAGAIFRHRGWGSWALTEAREENVADIERRARDYGLPPIAWPVDWPANSLGAQRAAVYACERAAGKRFALAAYTEAFVHGRDLSDLEVVLDAAAAAGLERAGVAVAVADSRIKDALRGATDAAIALGVVGVPSIRVGEQVLWGDDRLEEAAALAGRAT